MSFEKNFEVDRSRYDDANLNSKSKYIAKPGINEELVLKISSDKNEPLWMRKKRLQALHLFEKTKMPDWGPDLSELNLDDIVYYVDPDADEAHNWDEVPQEIKNTFDKLGIPEAERKSLAGVGAQYDSGSVYHNLKKEWEDLGIIFENIDVAVHKYPDLVKKYFMTNCVPISDHKFVMLHAAVFSGGTFIYIPKNVKIDIPFQAYFRMNAMKGGQFEHTLIIVDEGAEMHYIEGCSSPMYSQTSLHAGCVEIHVMANAKVKYSSIENWSRNMYNLNTKRAIVHKNGSIDWLNGQMGSCKTMLYPMSILLGEGSRSTSLGIALAGYNQDQDTGSKVVHIGANTSSIIKSKSISKDGGISSYRGLVKINPTAKNTISSVECDALLIDDISVSNTFPHMDVLRDDAQISHEAKVGRISDDEVFYLRSKGLSEEQAKQMIVSGFVQEVVKQLPLEYAVELNKLIELEMEGSIESKE